MYTEVYFYLFLKNIGYNWVKINEDPYNYKATIVLILIKVICNKYMQKFCFQILQRKNKYFNGLPPNSENSVSES